MPSAPPQPFDPELDTLARVRNFSIEAIQLLLTVKEQVILGCSAALGEWRSNDDPLQHAFADVIARLVELLDQVHVGGSLRIAQTSAREGTKTSCETIRLS